MTPVTGKLARQSTADTYGSLWWCLRLSRRYGMLARSSCPLSLTHAVLFDMSRSLLSSPPVGVTVVDPLPVSEQAAPRTG